MAWYSICVHFITVSSYCWCISILMKYCIKITVVTFNSLGIARCRIMIVLIIVDILLKSIVDQFWLESLVDDDQLEGLSAADHVEVLVVQEIGLLVPLCGRTIAWAPD